MSFQYFLWVSFNPKSMYKLIAPGAVDSASVTIVFYSISLRKFNSVETYFHYSTAYSVKTGNQVYLHPWYIVKITSKKKKSLFMQSACLPVLGTLKKTPFEWCHESNESCFKIFFLYQEKFLLLGPAAQLIHCTYLCLGSGLPSIVNG